MVTNTTYIVEKLEDIFNQYGATEEERAGFYMIAMETVARQMDELMNGVLNEDDMQILEGIEDKEESKMYIEQRFQEEVGRAPQEVSDELFGRFLQEAQTRGYKRMIEDAKAGK